MTQEEKNILIKELCMRIPYGVKCNINGELCKVTRVDVECQQVYLKKDDEHGGTYSIARGDIIKPYLRPLTSMTDEEMEDYARYKFSSNEIWEIVDFKRTGKGFINVNCKNRNDASTQWTFQVKQKSPLENYIGIDWLNAHHFDYRGLIEKGLALAAPEGMYN